MNDPVSNFVDFEGRTLFTDVKESPPGDTGETPIVLDENSSEMTTKDSSSPTLDNYNVHMPSLKVGKLCRCGIIC